MADTVRTRAALLALLPDNMTEDISPQDLRDVVVSLHGVYGEMSIQAGASAQGSISTTPAIVTGWNTNGLSDGTTPDHTTNGITITEAGIFVVDFSISLSALTASALFAFEIYKGAVAQGQVAEIMSNATPDRACVAGGGIVSCSAADVLSLYVYSNGAARTMTPTEGQFRVRRIS